MDDGEDSLFVPEAPTVIAPLAQSIASPRIKDTVSRTASSNVAPPGGADDVDATRLLDGTDNEREL